VNLGPEPVPNVYVGIVATSVTSAGIGLATLKSKVVGRSDVGIDCSGVGVPWAGEDDRGDFDRRDLADLRAGEKLSSKTLDGRGVAESAGDN
jgi:hypothetical protein